MILGFIGTGKISSCVIYGIFKSKLKVRKIYISSRNTNIAKKLDIVIPYQNSYFGGALISLILDIACKRFVGITSNYTTLSYIGLHRLH